MKILGRGNDGSNTFARGNSYLLEATAEEMEFLKALMGPKLEAPLSGEQVKEFQYLRSTVATLARDLGLLKDGDGDAGG